MTYRPLFVIGLFAALALAGCGPARSDDAAADAAAVCAGCHKGKLSLADGDPAELAASIRRIRDGERRHPPLELHDDSDAAIDALAQALAAE